LLSAWRKYSTDSALREGAPVGLAASIVRSSVAWRYRKVPQKDFKDLTPVAFSDLSLL